jgi:hypothetical protein
MVLNEKQTIERPMQPRCIKDAVNPSSQNLFYKSEIPTSKNQQVFMPGSKVDGFNISSAIGAGNLHANRDSTCQPTAVVPNNINTNN